MIHSLAVQHTASHYGAPNAAKFECRQLDINLTTLKAQSISMVFFLYAEFEGLRLRKVHLVSGIPHTNSVNAYENMASFPHGVNSCSALFGRGESPFVYPTMTLPMRLLESMLLFTSIALELREEFANRQIQLYGNIINQSINQ